MKKVLSLVLAVVLVLGMGAIAFGKIKDGFNTGALGFSGGFVTRDIRPDETFDFDIMYNWDTTNNVAAGPGRFATRQDIRDGKVDIQIRSTEGGAAIDSASTKIKYKTVGGVDRAYLQVAFVEEYVATKDLDFSVTIYLTSDKKRLDQSLELTGTFGNPVEYVSEGDDYVYLGDDHLVEAEDYIKNIRVDLGQGVSIYTKMFADKKYYGSVSQEVKAEDEALMAKYPDIDTAYYLKTIGLASSGQVVKFDLESNYYVYAQNEDGELVYVGRSNDKLAYYTKYFLSAKELDVEVDGGDIIEPGDGIELPPVTGGDEAPVNVNDNPSTGC